MGLARRPRPPRSRRGARESYTEHLRVPPGLLRYTTAYRPASSVVRTAVRTQHITQMCTQITVQLYSLSHVSTQLCRAGYTGHSTQRVGLGPVGLLATEPIFGRTSGYVFLPVVRAQPSLSLGVAKVLGALLTRIAERALIGAESLRDGDGRDIQRREELRLRGGQAVRVPVGVRAVREGR